MDPLNALAPALDVLRSVWRRGKRWIDSIRKLEINTDVLTQRKAQLDAKEADIKRQLQRAVRQGQEATHNVTSLLERVQRAKQQVGDLESSLEQNGRCFFDCWPCSREQLAPPRALSLPTTSTVRMSTVDENFNAILASLRDPSISKIGVYAMGGSGKTFTMMKINNELATTNDFDKIIWVTVPKDWSLDLVQKKIARRLDPHLDLPAYEEEVARAARLSESLARAGKVLLILDDMWEWLPLEKVGIP